MEWDDHQPATCRAPTWNEETQAVSNTKTPDTLTR